MSTTLLTSHRLRLAALALTAFGMAGCSDLTSFLRDELALESEMLDRVCLVVNDATAKDYMKAFEKAATDKFADFTKKKMELVDNLDKVPKVVWGRFDKLAQDFLNQYDGDEAINKVIELGKSDAPQNLIKELKEKLEEEKIFPKPGDWEKALLALPAANVLNRYLREKLALKIARQREVNRLTTYIANPENESAAMTSVLGALRPAKK